MLRSSEASHSCNSIEVASLEEQTIVAAKAEASLELGPKVPSVLSPTEHHMVGVLVDYKGS